MAPTTTPGDLFPEVGAPAGVLVVNERCVPGTQKGQCVVLVAGVQPCHSAWRSDG